MEIEAKFTIPNDKVYAWLKKVRRMQDFTIHTGSTQRLDDEYLDTPDRRIMRAGYTCRFRHKNGTRTVTLKALGHADGAIHYRQELETQIERAAAPQLWPPSPVQQQIISLIGDQPLEIIFTLQQERHKRSLTHKKQAVAEFCLDAVQQQHHKTQQKYSELEIELKGGGTEKDLRRFVKYLMQTQPLVPQSISKFKRGLAFISQSDNQALGNSSTNIKAPQVTPDDTIAEAGYKILRFYFQRMLHNEMGTILGQDIKALHDMRVATRRMRAARYIFKPYFDRKTLKPYAQWIKHTGQVLGAVRDMDVFYAKMQPYLHQQAQQAVFQPIFDAWNTAYDEAQTALLAHLSQRDYIQFKQAFATYLHDVTPTRPHPSTRVTPYRVKEIAPILIAQRLAAVYAYAEWLEPPNVPLARYHQLRIAIKYLRYTLEFFQNTLPNDVIQVILSLKTLQTHLGDLQDAIVACERLRNIQYGGQWGANVGQNTKALQHSSDIDDYYTHKQQEIQHLLTTFPDLWAHYQAPEFKEMLAVVVSRL